MRKAWLAPALLAFALLIQLTVLNGLHLPGGSVPDLVLVLVVAVAIADGPVRGTALGFTAGLCLDLAPPDSGLIGQYALVFCLAGWAAGRLGRLASRSPLRALGLLAVVVAAAEALTAALGLLLAPAQVSTPEIRQFLPVTIAYDLLLSPFVLYLVVMASMGLASTGLASTGLATRGVLAGPARSKRAERKRRPHEPRLGAAAARAGDGWVGGGPGRHPGSRPLTGRPVRLHPGSGVAGSASGLLRRRDRPVTPVRLRLSAARRGDGSIASVVGSGQGRHLQPRRHPGLLAGGSSQFRPRGGELGGSAARQHGPTRSGQARARINFGGHRGDASVGRRLGTTWLTGPGRAGPRLRMGASRSALTLSGRSGLATAVPTMQFRTAVPPAARRPVAAPKFRRRSGMLRPSALTTGLVAGGVLDQSTFRARRTRAGAPRLRLAGRGPGGGMLGGSGRSPLRRPPARARKQPRFGYGRRSLLSFLTGRHIGGRWLASKRAGSRSGVWLIGKRTGGAR